MHISLAGLEDAVLWSESVGLASERLIAYAATLAFIIVLFLLFQLTKVEEPVPTKLREALTVFRRARNWAEKGFVLFIYTSALFHRGYTALLVLLALAALVACVAIFGSADNTPLLKVFRDILQKAFDLVAP